MQRVDVDAVLQRVDRSGQRLRRMLEQIGLAGDHRIGTHPDQHRVDLIAAARQVAGTDNHVAATGVDLILQRQRDRQWRERFLEWPVERHDLLDLGSSGDWAAP